MQFTNPPKSSPVNHIIITLHAIDRYVERCDQGENNNYRNIIRRRLEKSTEEKSYLNNSNLMNYLFNTYGYNTRFRFLRDYDAIFVVVEENGQSILKTVFNSRFSIAKYLPNHKKYPKKK